MVFARKKTPCARERVGLFLKEVLRLGNLAPALAGKAEAVQQQHPLFPQQQCQYLSTPCKKRAHAERTGSAACRRSGAPWRDCSRQLLRVGARPQQAHELAATATHPAQRQAGDAWHSPALLGRQDRRAGQPHSQQRAGSGCCAPEGLQRLAALQTQELDVMRIVALNLRGCQRRRGALWPLSGQGRVPLSASQAERTVSVPMCTRSGHQVALPSMCPHVHSQGTSPELPPPDSHKAPVTAAAFCLNSLCYLIQELHLIER